MKICFSDSIPDGSPGRGHDFSRVRTTDESLAKAPGQLSPGSPLSTLMDSDPSQSPPPPLVFSTLRPAGIANDH